MIHYFILCRHTFWFTWGRLLPPCDDSNSTASLLSSLEAWDVDALLFVELTSTMLTSEFLIRYRILIWDRTIRSIGMNHAIINNIITYERSFKDGEKLSKVQPRKYAWNKWNIATSGYNYVGIEIINIIASIQYSYKLTSETKRFQPIRGNAANNIEAPQTNTIMKFAYNEYKFSTNNPAI